MELIEIIPGLATSRRRPFATRAFAESLGKQVVLSEDEPGFVVNRILLPMINEAVFVLGQGTANIADIDKGCRLGLNHPMGPLQLADFVGLDTCLEIMRVTARHHRRPQVPPGAAAGEIRRSRLARPQDRAGLLRIYRRGAGAHALAGTRPCRRSLVCQGESAMTDAKRPSDIAPETHNDEQDDESSQAQEVAEEARSKDGVGSPLDSTRVHGGIDGEDDQQDLVDHMRDMESRAGSTWAPIAASPMTTMTRTSTAKATTTRMTTMTSKLVPA